MDFTNEEKALSEETATFFWQDKCSFKRNKFGYFLFFLEYCNLNL